MSAHISNVRPDPDQVLVDIANYVADVAIESPEAWNTARLCLMDTLGCGLEALSYPACTKLMGPIVPGTLVPNGAKVPGTQMEIRQVSMDFSYSGSFTESSPEAYERLILDVLLGDPPLFPRQREVELSWQILDPVLELWAQAGQPEQYPAGTWGPHGSQEMLARDGFAWRRP